MLMTTVSTADIMRPEVSSGTNGRVISELVEPLALGVQVGDTMYRQ